jgi:hypothetical protein
MGPSSVDQQLKLQQIQQSIEESQNQIADVNKSYYLESLENSTDSTNQYKKQLYELVKIINYYKF